MQLSSLVLFQSLLVLLALMITGIIAYKTKLIDDGTYTHLSSFMVWVLNPFLMIKAVLGKGTSGISREMIWQNLIMVALLYAFLFLVGFAYAAMMRHKGKTACLDRMSLLFANVGFMGVPLVEKCLGPQYVVFVAFYTLAFNVLIYTYGIQLATKLGDKKEKFNPKNFLSPGIFASLLTILIFAFNIKVPKPVESFVGYLSNTTIAISMIIVGVFLARVDIKSAFAKVHYYIFVLFDMFILPFIFILLSKLFLPFDKNVISVAAIMILMPVGTMTCMFAQEYGGDGTESAKLIALTTISTVVCAPLVIALINMIVK